MLLVREVSVVGIIVDVEAATTQVSEDSRERENSGEGACGACLGFPWLRGRGSHCSKGEMSSL